MKKKPSLVTKKTKRVTLNIRPDGELNLDEVIELLKMPTQKRNKYDIKAMQNYMLKHIEYFQKLNGESDGPDRIPKLIQVLTYECFKKDDYIINFGEIGDKFYILLSGSVSVYKPSPKNMYMTLYDYVKYLVNIRDVEKNLLKFERVQSYNSNIDRVKLLLINYNPDKLPYSSKKLPLVVEEERFLVKLGPGVSFGEMALIKNEPRNADIIANETCILGSVDKIDYRKIIKDMEEQKINLQLKSFKMDFPFYNEWPASRCFRILSAFTTEVFNKDDYVYKQNSLPTHLYIIRKGEFQVTCDLNFSIYEQFVDYIYNDSNVLFKDMDKPSFWKEDNLHKKIQYSYEKNDSPFMSLPPISRFVLSHKAEIIPEINKNEYQKNDNNKNDLDEERMKEVSKMEDMENDMKFINNIKRRIKICQLEAPQMFGFIEPFELKKRFCNIKCESNEGEIQKIPFIEFLQLMPKDKKNRFILEGYIFHKKKDLIERLKNGTLAKLSFNYKKPQMKTFDVYPSRNLDQNTSNKSKLLIRSKSIILNHDQLNNAKTYYNKIQSEENVTFKKNKINDKTNLKTNNSIINGFKKALFSYNETITKTEMQYLISGLTNKKKKKEIISNFHLNGNNSVRIPKYICQNSVNNILPSKYSLVPHPETVGKNYIDFNSKRIINRININKDIFDNILKKKEGKKLPNIVSKRSNSLKGNQLQSLEKIQRKSKKNVSVLYRWIDNEKDFE